MITADPIKSLSTRFEFRNVPLNSIKVVETTNGESKKVKRDHIVVDGQEVVASDRFWGSLFSRYSFNSSVFNYFKPQEVFDRIVEVNGRDQLRLCIDTDPNTKQVTALASTSPEKQNVNLDKYLELLENFNGENITYSNGLIESFHKPTISDPFTIKGDEFSPRYVISTPVDGYGQPNTFLSLLRLICTNGTIGYSRCFKSTISVGKKEEINYNIERTMEQFNNDEGYVALRSRMESATESWASVFEAKKLWLLLARAAADHQLDVKHYNVEHGDSEEEALNRLSTDSSLFRDFHRLTGDTSLIYGLANIDSISEKKQRTLPTRASMYDLINFATEIGTHYAVPESARRINAWVGQTLSTEYDMEGTKAKFGSFADFHLTSTATAS